MLSNKPYLLRAFYQWIVDSRCTPVLVIDTTQPESKIPRNYAEDGEIVFNISPHAIRDLKMDNDVVEFTASFSGISHFISAPIKAILAVYAEENGEGIFFDGEEDTSGHISIEAAPEQAIQLKSIENSNNASVAGQQSSQSSIKTKPDLKLVE
jgi:stringent starvation protein B